MFLQNRKLTTFRFRIESLLLDVISLHKRKDPPQSSTPAYALPAAKRARVAAAPEVSSDSSPEVQVTRMTQGRLTTTTKTAPVKSLDKVLVFKNRRDPFKGKNYLQMPVVDVIHDLVRYGIYIKEVDAGNPKKRSRRNRLKVVRDNIIRVSNPADTLYLDPGNVPKEGFVHFQERQKHLQACLKVVSAAVKTLNEERLPLLNMIARREWLKKTPAERAKKPFKPRTWLAKTVSQVATLIYDTRDEFQEGVEI